MNGRRNFLKMLGFGTVAGMTGGVSKALADQLSDEVIQEGADKGMYSQETADEVINWYQAYDPPESAKVEFKQEIQCKPYVPEFNLSRAIYGLNFSKYLDRHLINKLELIDAAPGAMPKTVTAYMPKHLPPKVRFGDEEIDLAEGSLVHKKFQFEHLYLSCLIFDEDPRISMEEGVRIYVEPMLASMARDINENGYRYSAKLSDESNTYAAVKTWEGGVVPVRATGSYDHRQLGHTLTLECYVA